MPIKLCVVPGCFTRSRRYYITSIKNVQKVWLERINNPQLYGFKSVVDSVICGKHFDSECINEKKKLIKFSLPTLNLPGYQCCPRKSDIFLKMKKEPSEVTSVTPEISRKHTFFNGHSPELKVNTFRRVYGKERSISANMHYSPHGEDWEEKPEPFTSRLEAALAKIGKGQEEKTIKLVIPAKRRIVRDSCMEAKKKKVSRRCEAVVSRRCEAAESSHSHIYSENLQIFDEFIQKREPEESLGTSENQRINSIEICDIRKEHLKQNTYDQQRQYLIYTFMSPHKASEDDDNISFFRSLLPSLRELNPSQMLDFRIQTVQNLQRILCGNPASSQSTHSFATFHPKLCVVPDSTYFLSSSPSQQRAVPSYCISQQDEIHLSVQLSPKSESMDSNTVFHYINEEPDDF